MANIKLKRYTGSAWEQLNPETTWSQIQSKPSTFTPTSHTHTLSQITDAGTVAAIDTNGSTTQFLRGDGTFAAPNINGGNAQTLDNLDSTQFLRSDANDTMTGTLTASGGINGLTLANGISGSNFNITGVNQLSINDPGEGIAFGGGSSGSMTLALVDDANDNILRFNGTNAQLQVGTNRVLTTADEGSGNGIDADTLDGSHASAFYLASNPNGYTTNVGDITQVVAGTGLSGGGASGSVTLNLDLSELTDMTANISGLADELILLDAGAERRKLISEINLSQFNNDAGWTTSSGTVTSVATGGGLTGGTITGSGTISHADTSSQASVNNSGATFIQDVTLDTYGHTTGLASVTVTPALIGAATSSHNHDSRYYTETESNANFLKRTSTALLDVNAANGTQLYTGSTGQWTNRGPAGNNAGALLSLNTHSGNYYSQLWFDTANDQFYFRSANNSLPTGSWQKVWHDGNDGTSSGLDSDKLDGQHGSYYLDYNNFTNTPTIPTGDITGVTAGNGLTGGGSSGSVTLNVGAGTGITVAADTVSVDTSTIATQSWVNSQGFLTSETGDIQGVTAGTGLSGGGSSGTVTLNVDLSELTDMTADVNGLQDEIILLDNGADRRKLISEIKLSQFNNDAGWAAGDITNLTAGGGLSGGGSSGSVTISHADTSSQASLTALTGANVISDIDVDTYGHITSMSTRALTAANIGAAATSHTHSNYVATAGDTMTGDLVLDHDGTGTVSSHGIVFTSQFNSIDVTRELNINSSGNLVFNGTEAELTDTQLTTEQVQDIVGNMVSGNTESGITVTYQDSDGTLDFSVAGGGNTWTLIKSGSTTISSGTAVTNVSLGSNTVDDTTVLAFELNTGSALSYTSQIFIIKLEDSDNGNAGILYNAGAYTTSIRTGSLRVFRTLSMGPTSTSISFTDVYYHSNGSSVETADTVYVGNIWKLGVTGA